MTTDEGIMPDQDDFDFVAATKSVRDLTAGVFNPSADTDRTDLEMIGEKVKAVGMNWKDALRN